MNALAGTDGAAKKPGDVLGTRTWLSSGASKFVARLEKISKDGKSVTLSHGKKTVTVPVDKLTGHDQALIRGLQALPENVTLSTEGLKKNNQQQWVEAVILDLGRLNELPSGKELLARIAKNTNSITIKVRDDEDGIGNRINYTPAKGGSKDAIISYSPTDRKGWKVDGDRGSRDRPPFLALGKELWTGDRAAVGGDEDTVPAEERESAKFENTLRDQFNASAPADERVPHRDVPR